MNIKQHASVGGPTNAGSEPDGRRVTGSDQGTAQSQRGELLPWQRGLANNNRHGDSFAFARVHGSADLAQAGQHGDTDAERRSSLMTLFAECDGYAVYHRLSAVSVRAPWCRPSARPNAVVAAQVTSHNASEVRYCVATVSGAPYAAKVIPRVRRMRTAAGTVTKRGARARMDARKHGRRALRLGVSAQAAVEMEALQRLKHPNIVECVVETEVVGSDAVQCGSRSCCAAAFLPRLHAVVEDARSQRVFLILELMGGASLASAHLVYTEQHAKTLMFQLLTAIEFVHDHDIVHR